MVLRECTQCTGWFPGSRLPTARTQRGVRGSWMLTYSDAKFDKDRRGTPVVANLRRACPRQGDASHATWINSRFQPSLPSLASQDAVGGPSPRRPGL